jgi:Leucine-rich repeat (LRR) protein
MTPAKTPLNKLQRLVLAIILVAFAATLLNWPRTGASATGAAKDRAGVRADAIAGDSSRSRGLSVSAGWPLTFYRSAEPTAHHRGQFSLSAGIADFALFAVAALIFVFGNDVIQRCRTIRPPAWLTVRRLAVGSFMIAAIGAGPLAWNFWLARVEIRERAALWQRYGHVGQSNLLALRAVHYLPQSWQVLLREPRSVHLIAPTREALEQLAITDSLESISISRTALSPSDLERLANLPNLTQLRLVRCSLTDAHCAVVSRLPKLEKLEVLDCDGAQQLLDALVSHRSLTELLVNNLSWSNAPEVAWKLGDQLQRLELGFAHADSVHELAFADHGQLTVLRIYQTGMTTGDASLNIRLANLPSLQHVGLPNNLPVSVDGINLAQLVSLDPQGRRYDGIDSVGRSLRLRSLSLDIVPSLRVVRCNSDWLQDIAIRNAPALQILALSPFSGVRLWGPDQPAIEASAMRIERIIDQLAKCDSPQRLDLEGLPLTDVDLSPLAHHKQIRSLSLAGSGVSVAQIETLSGMDQLESLDLSQCRMRDGDVERILAAFPRLQTLAVQTEDLTRLELVDHPYLQQMPGASWGRLTALKIVRCPDFRAELRLGDRIHKIEICDSPSLQTLEMQGPLPVDAVLQGFRDLRVLQLIGASVTDETLDAFQPCNRLIEMTLEQPSLTAAGIMKISNITNLYKLALPGAKLTDALAAELIEANEYGFQEVNFSHTDISGATLHRLVNCKNLQRLNIGYTRVSATDLHLLADINSLYELEIGGLAVTAAALQGWLATSRVNRLDLSDCQLEERLKHWSFVPPSLHFLGLERCSLADDDIVRLLEKSPALAVGIDGNPISASIICPLLQAGQLIDVQDREGYQYRLDVLAGVYGAQKGSDALENLLLWDQISRVSSEKRHVCDIINGS